MVTVNPQAEGKQIIARAELKSAEGSRVEKAYALPVGSASPLSIKISAGNSPINYEEMVPILITVSNASEFPRTDVQIRLPFQLELYDYSDVLLSHGGDCSSSTCNFHGDFMIWELDELPAQSSRSISAMPTVLTAPSDNMLNFHAVVEDNSGLAVRTSENLITTQTRGAELKLETDKYPLLVGEAFSLNINYGVSLSGVAMSAPKLQVELPEEVSLISPSDDGTTQGNTVTWSLPPIAPGQSGVVSVSLRVNNEVALLGNSITFRTRLDDENTILSNGQYTRTKIHLPIVEERELDLAIEQSVNTLTPGGGIVLTFLVTNTSTFSRDDISVFMRYPEEFESIADSTIVDGECPGSSCDTDSEYIVWNIGQLSAGESKAVSMESSIFSTLEPGSIVPIFVGVSNASATTTRRHFTIRVTEP